MINNESLALALTPFGEPMTVPKGAMIFDIGEPCTGVYVVHFGTVDLSLLDEHWQRIWSRCVPAGGVLGLPAAVSCKEYSLRAVAQGNTELVFVPATTIQSLIRQDANIGLQVLQAMSAEVIALRKKFAMFKA